MERYDSKDIYCRMLGHAVQFQYCRKAKDMLPCRKILDCWFELLPVEEYINENFSEEEKKKIFSSPESKISTIFSLLEKAKKNKK